MQQDKSVNEKGKQAVKATLTDNILEDRECGRVAGCDDDEMNDSDWEDCPIPSLDDTFDANVDDTRELTIEFDDVPDAKKQKNAYRATAKDKVYCAQVNLRKCNMFTSVSSSKMSGSLRDLCFVLKERAELVHKVHLLCLLARGRIVDNACNDPLIQVNNYGGISCCLKVIFFILLASVATFDKLLLNFKFDMQAALLSLLPSYLLKVTNLEKVTVKDIAPLLRWVWFTGL